MRHNEEILELFSQSQFEMKEIVLQKLIHFKTALVNRYLEMIHSNGDIFENCVPQHLLPF